MLKSIEIHGVGGIREARLSFGGNFTVITGESGAGKSSLVRAMEFITGARARENNIHTLEEKCEVDAVISQNGEDVTARRTFARNGKGKIYISNKPATLSALISLVEQNIIIQSQFAQLTLLDPARQLELVDSCGGEALRSVQRKLEEVFYKALKTEKEIVSIKKRRSESEKTYDNAPEIIRHIKALGLTAQSEHSQSGNSQCEHSHSELEWERELEELEKTEKRSRMLRLISDELEAENSITDKLEKISAKAALCENGDDKALSQAAEAALNAVQELSGRISAAVKSEMSSSEIESAREAAEKKLGLLRKIKRILNLRTTDEVMEYVKNAEHELAWLKTSREELNNLERTAQALRHELKSTALDLRTQRKKAAQHLSESVNRHIHEMSMEYALFGIDIVPQDKIGANGAEIALFTLSMPDAQGGSVPLPIDKNASGGELSRILIAVQLSVSDDKLPETLVFDEVEAGLGGKTALLAGYKLKSLSQRCRTILITHQATIAAMADTHYVVRRVSDNTVIEEINGDAREKEIARMLSGDESSSEAIEHARSLLREE